MFPKPQAPTVIPNLLGWYTDGLALTQKLARLLEEQGVHFMGAACGTAIFEWKNRWFTLCDNGGEINVKKVE